MPSKPLPREPSARAGGLMPRTICPGSHRMGKKWKKLCICLAGASLCVSAAVGNFLFSCVVQCQGPAMGDTLGVEEKLASLQKENQALEEQRDGARAEVRELWAELAGTNQTLWETRGHWESCRSLTHDLQSNLTALQNTNTQLESRDSEWEAKEQRLQEETGRLREELSSWSQKLWASQQKFQEERDQLQARIHWLKVQLQSRGSHSSRVSLYLLLILSLSGTLLL
ncbi:uncharacterized protein LOC142002481 [Carettochelys insculpta]|uniref:uncharacterized protein LOC142002481 n=1 Tax=Carettochelys insculpta TaxID=44489 RepID=UPI003EBB26C6